MNPLQVTIIAVRPALRGERYLGVNLPAGIAAVTTWLAEHPTPGSVLIVATESPAHFEPGWFLEGE